MFPSGFHGILVSGIGVTRDSTSRIIGKDTSKPAFCQV
jgi:hypothetical protein